MTDVAALVEAVLVRPALVIGGPAALAGFLRRRAAAARHAVWVGTVVALLTLPLAQRAVPPLVIPVIGNVATHWSSDAGVGSADQRVIGSRDLPRTATLALAGIVVGSLGAIASTRWMRSMLFDVDPLDPLIFAGAGVALAAVAIGATWAPALRATRVSPVTAMRND